jgi:hypothetical protein
MSKENPENGALGGALIFTVPAWGFVVALSLERIGGLAWPVFNTSAHEK